MFKKAKENKKGFTLAELLIVVAIIAVLVEISIPIFTSQLEKAKQSTDAANLRAAYAEAVMASLDNDGGAGTSTTPVKITSNGKFDKIGNDAKIGTITLSTKYATTPLTTGSQYDVKVAANGTTEIVAHTGSGN